MSVEPLRDFLVVSKEEVKQTKGGLFIPTTAEEKVIKGVVKAVGSGLLTSDGKVVPLEVKVGDTVVFNKNLAVEVTNDDETVFVVREEHILCKVNS